MNKSNIAVEVVPAAGFQYALARLLAHATKRATALETAALTVPA